MSDVEYLLAYAKQCHEAKDAADILDIAQDIGQLDNLYQQGNPKHSHTLYPNSHR